MLVSKLRREAKSTRAGVQWNTPTPAQRTRDVQHVDFVDDLGPEEEWEQYDGYESGNEGVGELERLSRRPKPGRILCRTRVGTGPASRDTSFDFYADSVIDLCNVEGGREVAMKVEARMMCYDGRDGGIGVMATIDGGAMLCVLDLADGQGTCARSRGTGRAWIEINGVRQEVEYEVLDSKGAFALLVGKTWLRAASALHNFANDTLILHADTGPIIVENQNPTLHVQEQQAPTIPAEQQPPPNQGEEQPTADDDEGMNQPTSEETAPEIRPIINDIKPEQQPFRRSKRLAEKKGADLYWVSAEALEDAERRMVELADEEDEWWDALEVQTLDEAAMPNPGEAVKVYTLDGVLDRAARNEARKHAAPEPLPTRPRHIPSLRTTDPFNTRTSSRDHGEGESREDLTVEQRERVDGLIREFADVFARSLSEVLPVDITELRLDIPDDTTFPKKAGQRRLTEPQRIALYHTLDELEEAGIIERVSQEQVKAQLQRMANAECIKYNIPVRYPEVGTEPIDEGTDTQQAKWRLVQNFAAVNKVTQIRPFPMGDLPAKQRWAAGKRYVSVMDLQAGFHAIPIAKESIPFTGFHVDGRGYYVYCRMPFGLTGAPTTFCEMLATALHDLIGVHIDLWMDDIASAADDFDTALGSLRLLFERCRTHKLSLSPAKSVFFMSEATFAGARVSKEGVQPDLRKVRAILEWPEPQTVLEVMSFLGLVGSYRTKIKDYARIARPLSDLTRDIKVETPTRGRGLKQAYRRALNDRKVAHTDETRRAFVELKLALTSEPVVRAPIYDGRPFIVSTDGSKYGFGAVLEQEWTELGRHGQEVKVRYPIAYASKRTSRSEERYIPFLLEFAALKYALDEFDDMIFGQPIELETDCKALADLLGNQKLNSTHERWRESIIGRDIRAVRHLPGVQNTACDALSRVYEHRPEDEGGHLRDTDVDQAGKQTKAWFADDSFYADILRSLLFDAPSNSSADESEERARKRRAHRAEGYQVENGKLWLVAGKNTRRRDRVECIPSSEAKDLALSVHSAGGHFGRDMTVLALQQRYFWPTLRRDATEAVVSCPRCKNFGPRLRTAQLQPITRAKPFDLMVGDYLSLPVGQGKFKTVLLLIDVYSRYLFTFPSRNPGTGKFTVDALTRVSDWLLTPTAFMADGGKHFDCEEVKTWAAAKGVQHITTPAYAPWTNGLAEGHVKLLIGRLKRLCAGAVGEARDDEGDDDATTVPESWPKHLAQATSQLNDRLLPSLGFAPRELMTGVIRTDRRAELASAIWDPRRGDVHVNMGLTYAMRNDAFSEALRHAAKRKKAFDKHISPTEFQVGDLVQRYDSRLDKTHSSMRKLAPRWSGPLRIVGRSTNSYRLEDLHGNHFSSATHTPSSVHSSRAQELHLLRTTKLFGLHEKPIRKPQSPQLTSPRRTYHPLLAPKPVSR
ncbi:Retrovirus-related Pol polyprotein from transposon opus [Ceratobasidium sp. AG-Ba]|nr:Retrovirus-related Pol polyprotein from transposon opus [Ceratobasidium sp. AG-Ba]